jgi:NAD-dependent DNA ligase
MKTYTLESVLPAWHFAPATTRQLKLLRFFGTDISKPLTKGVCSGIITRLFSDPAKKHLWAAYVFTTGDEDDSSTDLQPHDRAALASVRIPDDWRPNRGSGTTSSARKALEQMVADILKEGSPFDDPLPDVAIAGTAFCFTGEFEFGTRKECQAAVTVRGGMFTDGITRKTQVLVIGNDPNPNWSHGTYGNKIAEAMILRLQHTKPNIIPELLWRKLLSESSGNA